MTVRRSYHVSIFSPPQGKTSLRWIVSANRWQVGTAGVSARIAEGHLDAELEGGTHLARCRYLLLLIAAEIATLEDSAG